MAPIRYVIVGGGLAAATAAEELRERDGTGEIHIFAGERHNPYIRPPLSKGFILGTDGRDTVFAHPGDWYREHDITLVTGERVANLGDHAVEFGGGRSAPFDRLLLATGATPRLPDVPGSTADGIHTLRTLEDSDALKALLEPGGHRVAVIGAGWIGLELAAAARTYGNDVTVIAPGRVALARALGDEVGAVFQGLHEAHGVAFRMGTHVTGFTRSDGSVSAITTDAGDVPADLVIVAVGVEPDTALAEAAGLALAEPQDGGGILVDEHMATSAPDVFAAGDVANAYHPVIKQRMRNEHWANAIAGGKVAGASMAGADVRLDDIPYFYTDQYDLGMEYSGYPPLTRDAEVVYRGDLTGREFIAFWLAGDRVVAGMNVNVWDVNEDVQALIRRGTPVDRARLTDPAIPLTEV